MYIIPKFFGQMTSNLISRETIVSKKDNMDFKLGVSIENFKVITHFNMKDTTP